MIQKSIFIEYREDNLLTNANEVVLADVDNIFGIKNAATGDVFVAAGAAVDNPSTGVYEYTADFEEDTAYVVSWKITTSGTPRYVVQTIGPFPSTSSVRAVADFRGTLLQNSVNNLFLKTINLDGTAADPTDVSVSIANSDGDVIVAGTPDRISPGYYAFEWTIAWDLPQGDYTVTWSYTSNGADRTEVQSVTVAATGSLSYLYSGRVLEVRLALESHLQKVQNIPVYNEQAKPSADLRTFSFTFKNWNQSAGVRIYRNGNIVTSGFEVNYFKGYVTFDSPVTAYDQINADYNFRWFTDEELDRFLSNATHIVNSYPPVGRKTIVTIEQNYIVHILYGAIVDALRMMMLALKFQEPQLVFGGPEGAKSAFADFETLKKNYEGTWKDLLEQKKNQGYKGLTRFITTPPFNLPGGRSRWFRYLFSGGGG